jgi:hypothetical protein
VQQLVDFLEQLRRKQSLAKCVMEKHVTEQLDMIKVLVRLTIGIGGAEDKRARVEPAILLLGMIERLGETAITEVVKCRITTKESAY